MTYSMILFAAGALGAMPPVVTQAMPLNHVKLYAVAPWVTLIKMFSVSPDSAGTLLNAFQQSGFANSDAFMQTLMQILTQFAR